MKKTDITFINNEIDAVVKAIVEADRKGIIRKICISKIDFTDGVLHDQYAIIAASAGFERADFKMVSCIEEKFGSVVEWALEIELPKEYVTLWEKQSL